MDVGQAGISQAQIQDVFTVWAIMPVPVYACTPEHILENQKQLKQKWVRDMAWQYAN